MINNLTLTNNVSFLLVFIEGLLSFLSPCVIPLIPIYMSYLAGNAKQTMEDGSISYKRSKVFLHTVFFILGISFAFFLLGTSFSALGSFFKDKQLLFTRIGGILIVILGLHQIGFLKFKFLNRERKLHFRLQQTEMNPLAALFMGFTFSFAWTPCVGPALSSVIILATGAKTQLIRNLLILVYSAGFIIPILLLGLFTTQVLNFLKKHQNLLKYTVKVGGAILILIGIMTFTGWMNGITRYLNLFNPPAVSRDESSSMNDKDMDSQNDSKTDGDTNTSDGSKTDQTGDNGEASSDVSNANETGQKPSGEAAPDTSGQNNGEEDSPQKIAAFDFTLKDQYGNEHTLSEYKGKVVFLNFWATWCPPCKKEMPDIEDIYMEYGENKEDVIILGVANPSSNEYPNNNDERQDRIVSFLETNEYSFPTVFDVTGEVLSQYYITSFPTTFLIDKEGYIYGYAEGMLTKEIMESAIQQTMEASE